MNIYLLHTDEYRVLFFGNEEKQTFCREFLMLRQHRIIKKIIINILHLSCVEKKYTRRWPKMG